MDFKVQSRNKAYKNSAKIIQKFMVRAGGSRHRPPVNTPLTRAGQKTSDSRNNLTEWEASWWYTCVELHLPLLPTALIDSMSCSFKLAISVHDRPVTTPAALISCCLVHWDTSLPCAWTRPANTADQTCNFTRVWFVNKQRASFRPEEPKPEVHRAECGAAISARFHQLGGLWERRT